ncbi:excalibur calcium-binding domain-containing protein [Neobacillus cucumis]|nr:excalibur calcium-binding domain-containing protein [Neobacillus cucumis]
MNNGSSTGSSGESAGGGSTTSSGGKEIFANCTELIKKYPNGVPSNHPAYQSKMDRDHDNYACER